RHGMPLVAVRPHFEERRPVATPRTLYGFVHRVVYGDNIHAVNRCTGHVETEAHFIDVNHVGCAAYRCTHGVAVVFTYEDNGQFPEHGHIEGFIECTLPYGTIAHVAHVDIVDAIIFFRKRDTSAQRNLAAYDTVPAHEFVFFAEKVHGAAFAFGTSHCFAKKFGHDGIGRYTLGEGVSVATVGRNHRIFGAQNRHGACYHGLLADVEVAKSTDFLLSV